MELKGIITKVYDLQEGTTERGTWKRQEFIVEHGEISEPKKVVLILRGEASIERVKPMVGKKGTFRLDIIAEEWNNRFYNKIYCFGFEEIAEVQAPQPVQAKEAPELPY